MSFILGMGVKIFCCENFASIRISRYLEFKQIVQFYTKKDLYAIVYELFI